MICFCLNYTLTIFTVYIVEIRKRTNAILREAVQMIRKGDEGPLERLHSRRLLQIYTHASYHITQM